MSRDVVGPFQDDPSAWPRTGTEGPPRRGAVHHGRLLVILLVALFALYSCSSYGMRHANDGSHYALVRSMADGNLSIDGYEEYTGFVDYSMRDGRYYSDKPPGLSVLALPFYAVGRLLAGSEAASREPLPDYESRADPANHLVPPLEEWSTNLLASLAGTITVLLVFLTARELGANGASSLFVAAASGLGTMLWRYSTAFFSHSVSAALVMAAVYLTLRAFRRDGRVEIVGLGLVAGLSVTVDYTNVFLMVGIVLALILGRARRGLAVVAGDLAMIAAAALIPIGLLTAYHWSAFGSPLRTSYQYKEVARFAFSHSFTESYSAPITNLWPLLLQPRWGVVAWCPLLLLTPFGVWALARRDRPAAILLVLSSVPFFLLFAKFVTPEGGATQDARYLTPALAPLIVSLAIPLTYIASPLRRRLAWGVACLFALCSLVLQGARLLVMPGHRERMIGGPAITRSTSIELTRAMRSAVQAAFPSIRFAPAAVLVAAVVCGAGWVLFRRRLRQEGGPDDVAPEEPSDDRETHGAASRSLDDVGGRA